MAEIRKKKNWPDKVDCFSCNRVQMVSAGGMIDPSGLELCVYECPACRFKIAIFAMDQERLYEIAVRPKTEITIKSK